MTLDIMPEFFYCNRPGSPEDSTIDSRGLMGYICPVVGPNTWSDLSLFKSHQLTSQSARSSVG
ncbi:MAG: hypothetical protein AB1733_12585 [Thermodesulfobacteriota bacterium]